MSRDLKKNFGSKVARENTQDESTLGERHPTRRDTFYRSLGSFNVLLYIFLISLILFM
jgi:hypothetical protein